MSFLADQKAIGIKHSLDPPSVNDTKDKNTTYPPLDKEGCGKNLLRIGISVSFTKYSFLKETRNPPRKVLQQPPFCVWDLSFISVLFQKHFPLPGTALLLL